MQFHLHSRVKKPLLRRRWNQRFEYICRVEKRPDRPAKKWMAIKSFICFGVYQNKIAANGQLAFFSSQIAVRSQPEISIAVNAEDIKVIEGQASKSFCGANAGFPPAG